MGGINEPINETGGAVHAIMGGINEPINETGMQFIPSWVALMNLSMRQVCSSYHHGWH